MKRTEIEKKERELKRKMKKEMVLQRKSSAKSQTARIREIIDDLVSRFRYDEEMIFNIKDDISILEVVEAMKAEIPESKWPGIIRKAIKKTGIKNKESAFEQMMSLL